MCPEGLKLSAEMEIIVTKYTAFIPGDVLVPASGNNVFIEVNAPFSDDVTGFTDSISFDTLDNPGVSVLIITAGHPVGRIDKDKHGPLVYRALRFLTLSGTAVPSQIGIVVGKITTRNTGP